MTTTARYGYIASAEPYAALDILNKYGYSLQGDNVTTDDIGGALEQMISEHGEQALVDTMSLHPDKGIIVELFGSTPSTATSSVIPPLLSESKEKNFLHNPTNAVLLGIGILVAIVVIKS